MFHAGQQLAAFEVQFGRWTLSVTKLFMVQLINLKCARMRARAHTHTHIHTHIHTHTSGNTLEW